MSENPNRADIYSRVTAKIVADLERGVRPWLQPWNAEHLAGRVSRPLRATGQAYKGINVIALWMESVAKGYSCPIWMIGRRRHKLRADAAVQIEQLGAGESEQLVQGPNFHFLLLRL